MDSHIYESDLLERFNLDARFCCTSCHDDEDWGYAPMPTVDLDGQEVSVCCAHADDVRKHLKAEEELSQEETP